MKTSTFTPRSFNTNLLKTLFLFLLAFSGFLWGCDKAEEIPPISEKFELGSKLTVKATTSTISQMFLNMGVTEIAVETNAKQTIFKFNTKKGFVLNENPINLTNYKLVLQNEVLSIKGHKNYGVTMIEGLPYISSPNFKGSITAITKNDVDEKVVLLLLFMHELTTNSDLKVIFSEKTLSTDAEGSVESCGFLNTYYRYSVNFSKSTTEAELEGDSWDSTGCTKIGGIDTSCMFDSHMCTSTQAYCC